MCSSDLLYVSMDALRTHVAWVYFVQHLGAMTALGLMFGNTLRGTHAQALCSQIAALLLPQDMDATYLRYTWWVTAAWTAFFALNALISVGLFVAAPISWWSLFANILTPVLTGVMFAAEFLMRQVALPNRAHISIASTIAAYRRFQQGER